MEGPNSRPRAEPPSLGFAIVLIVLGLVVVLSTGLCTGTFFFYGAVTGPDWRAAAMPLVIGGPFVIGGGMLLWYGVKHLRAYFRKSDEG